MSSGKIRTWIIVAFLVSSISLSATDKEEKAAIRAIKKGNIEFLRSYLNHHDDVNCSFSDGRSGLYYAIRYDQFRISHFLLRGGADPEVKTGEQTLLRWAIYYNRPRIARLLIEFGADVNLPDGQGDTPLIYASRLNNFELCKILVDRRADPLQANLEGQRASDVAAYDTTSITYTYLQWIGQFKKKRDSIPSMHDGPYIYLEEDNLAVMTYYERIKEKNLTRIVEKTIEIDKKDTIVDGFGWDTLSYHIKHDYSPHYYNIRTSGNIFAIGDIHGSYDVLVNLLLNNNIINAEMQWIFGKGQLVLLGDVFDRRRPLPG